VEYRGDGNFAFGDLIVGASNALADAFKKAKASANSWNKKHLVTSITQREDAFAEEREKAGVNQWQLNVGVHYNPWADLTKEDFEHVVEAYKAFTAHFSCMTCGGLLYASPEYRPKEVLRCGCGDVSLNLVVRLAGQRQMCPARARGKKTAA
jgi:hypothetical protein